jgi:N-carbamoyl-L-amino-acid hydrolase
VRGPRGTGLSRAEIIETFERRVAHPIDFEREEACATCTGWSRSA